MSVRHTKPCQLKLTAIQQLRETAEESRKSDVGSQDNENKDNIDNQVQPATSNK